MAVPGPQYRAGNGPWLRALAPVEGNVWRYLIAVLAFAASVLFRYALQDTLGQNVPFLQFYPALIVAAWYGGLGPGALGTALAVAASAYYLLPPDGFAVGGVSDQISLAVFAATGLFIGWLSQRVHDTGAALQSSAEAAHGRAERLDAILNTTTDGVIVIDAKGSIEAFNPGAERLFGYPAAEVIGRNVSVLMPSPDHERHDGYVARYLDTGEARIIGTGREVTGRRRDGTLFPVRLAVSEMRIGGDRKFTGMLHDLTQRAQLGRDLEASEARWRAIIDSAVDGIIVIDEHGRIEAFNAAAERLFGHKEQDLLGRNVDMLMPSPYREEHDSYLSRYLATGRAKIIGVGREVTGLRRDGSTFPLHLSVGQITIDAQRRFTGILHDLSERVRMETVLREQASLAKIGEMAAVIAHEIKNPLAGISGAIQILDSELAERGDSLPVLKEIIDRIDSLDRMVKDLLVFARPPKPRLSRVDVAPLVATTVGLLSADPALQEITVEVAGDAPPVSADSEMLRIVFQNLLLNSAHAMEGRGQIQVAVKAEQAVCHVSFTDNGPGIPADVRERIFTPFFTTKTRGTGLGLPTAKRLIEAHKGLISIDCPPAGGTVVSITLPLD
jgi:two-component system sensor kinase FixL